MRYIEGEKEILWIFLNEARNPFITFNYVFCKPTADNIPTVFTSILTINVSAPPETTPQKINVDEHIQASFSNGGKIVHWDKMIVSLDLIRLWTGFDNLLFDLKYPHVYVSNLGKDHAYTSGLRSRQSNEADKSNSPFFRTARNILPNNILTFSSNV